jgi:hypothetical protein
MPNDTTAFRAINGRLPAERTTGSRNAVELGMAAAEGRAALAEFSATLPDFCKRLDIPPAWLNLSTPELLMLVCMRQQKIIDDTLALVMRDRFPPAQE